MCPLVNRDDMKDLASSFLCFILNWSHQSHFANDHLTLGEVRSEESKPTKHAPKESSYARAVAQSNLKEDINARSIYVE